MKKLYTALLSSVLTLSAFTAQADDNDVTITCNHSDAAYVQYYANGSQMQVDLAEGDNSFTVADYTGFYVYAKTGYVLSSITSNEVYASMPNTSYGTFYVQSGYTDGVHVNVELKTLEEAYDGTVTITVDDPSKVTAQFSSNYRDALADVEANTPTEVRYMTSAEGTLYVSAKTYGSTLYKVTQNGNDVASSYGNYTIYLTSGDQIGIQADFPDADATVAINYASEKAQGYLTGVSVEGTPVEDFSNGFTAKLGDNVTLSFDNNNYKFNSLKVNGNSVYYYGYGDYTFQLTAEENTIDVDATKYETFTATINVDDPDRVYVKRPSGYSTEQLTLVAGDNTLEFVASQNDYLTITPATDCYLVSVSDGTNEYFTSGSSYCYVTITEGMTLTITTGAIARDNHFVLYVDNLDGLYTSYLSRSTRSNVSFSAGYTVVDFDASENPFQAGFYGENMDPHFYLNGEELTATSSSSNGINFSSLTFADGDVAKVFLFGAPSTYNVTFEVADDAQADFTVTTDLMTEVENYAEGLSVMTNTQVDIVTTAEDASVVVNGEPLEAVDGKYTFTVNADTAVTLGAGQSGVESVAVAPAAVENGAVYNLQGVKVLSNAANMSKLPAGVYIVNGKKVVVK
jgi:hypothetical protein